MLNSTLGKHLFLAVAFANALTRSILIPMPFILRISLDFLDLLSLLLRLVIVFVEELVHDTLGAGNFAVLARGTSCRSDAAATGATAAATSGRATCGGAGGGGGDTVGARSGVGDVLKLRDAVDDRLGGTFW